MEALITSTFRALRSLFAPGMFGLFVVSIGITIAALIGFVGLSSIFFNWLAAHMQGHMMAYFLPWLGSIGTGILAWFLFPGIMPVIVSFFDNRIAGLIETHDYPAAAPGHMPAFWPELWHDIRFSLVVIFLNILVLPLYLFFHVFSPIIFYWLNGYLLGREFFVMAARRHCLVQQAETLRKRHNATVTIAGVALAIMATIPIVNLFAPFWGIAVMVHLYHRLSAIPRSQLLLP